MASGLVALLDDVAAIAKLAAASLDDVTAAAGRAGSKAIGVVVDDAAVTPRYVTGFTPKRELPIIWKIAVGSIRNKLLFLLPAALLLSAFAPAWAIPALLIVGGTYLCFEGAEKVIEALGGAKHGADEDVTGDPAELEKKKIAGAIRTDFILSAEIMAIALAEVATLPILNQAIVLAIVALVITAGVYGVVGLIVKMDDIGLHLAKTRTGAMASFGRGLVKAMPILMRALAVIGTAAMLWVGGQIIVHQLHYFHLTPLPDWIHDAGAAAGHAVPAIGGALEWIVAAALSGLFGLVIGSIVAVIVNKLFHKNAAHA
ncbi:DUF808 domain-containing protein [Sphingomonas sp. 1P06PA]|uniref:DUF808 domain-containing protein n=1 Tax=Sphingomonas sp. 1P06PA TaxID=554121 RepID=UPI0039A75102